MAACPGIPESDGTRATRKLLSFVSQWVAVAPQAEPIKTRVPTRVQWTLWAPHRAEQLGAHRARGQPQAQCRATGTLLGRGLGDVGAGILQWRAADSRGPHIRDTSEVAAWMP
jgi:hypothetical protein